MIALAAAAGLALAMALSLVRLFIGPTLHDRTLAAKTVLIKAALMCAAASVALGRSDFVDVAIALVFAALVILVAAAKVFRVRTFQAPLCASEDV